MMSERSTAPKLRVSAPGHALRQGDSLAVGPAHPPVSGVGQSPSQHGGSQLPRLPGRPDQRPDSSRALIESLQPAEVEGEVAEVLPLPRLEQTLSLEVVEPLSL